MLFNDALDTFYLQLVTMGDTPILYFPFMPICPERYLLQYTFQILTSG